MDVVYTQKDNIEDLATGKEIIEFRSAIENKEVSCARGQVPRM